MKYIKMTRVYPTGKALFLFCITSLTITACTVLSPKSAELTDAEACHTLKELIADHPNQFKKARKSQSESNHASIWSAEKMFQSADICQVWKWSTGLFSYFCEWKTGSDENQASENYQYAVDVVKSCLGNEWTAHSAPTPSGGKRTYFDTPNKNTIVEIRYYLYNRSWLDSWQTVVIVGDKSNLKAPLN